MKRIATLTCVSLMSLGLMACNGGSGANSEPASKAAVERQTSDPAKAVEAVAAKIKDNNVLEAIQLSVTPAKLDEIRAEWKKNMADEPSEEDKKKFAETMSKLTASDAEDTLYAELEPLLQKFDTEMAAQMPMMIGMGQGFAMQSIEANPDFSAEQKKQAGEVVNALAGWLQTVKISDRDLAKKAINVTVKTARQLDLNTLDQVRALDFDQAMGKAGIVLGGVKDILKVYGLDVNDALGSTKADIVSNEGGKARVAVSYSLLGHKLSGEQEMVEIDGRWYNKDTMEGEMVNNLTEIVPGASDSSQ